MSEAGSRKGAARSPRSRRAGKAGRQTIDLGATDQPVIILDHPQLGENIGFAARAMLNCGLVKLRLVAPREAWPNDKAIAAAAGATALLDAAEVFETLPDAIADLTRVYATTARPRGMRKPVFTARSGAAEIVSAARKGQRVGILYGRERIGLDNEEIALAQAIIEVPLNPEFPSLNLAQAVLLTAYEWRMAATEGPEAMREGGPETDAATGEDMAALFDHLEGELTRAGYLFPPEKAPRMARNLRTLLLRADLTHQEVRTLRGVIKALATGRGKGNTPSRKGAQTGVVKNAVRQAPKKAAKNARKAPPKTAKKAPKTAKSGTLRRPGWRPGPGD